MLNYEELFNVVYSTEIPESIKPNIFNKLSDVNFILNESLDDAKPILEVLDLLTYSDLEEARINSIIDDIFSSTDESLIESVYESYIQEKLIEYVELLEETGHGTNAIGLAGLRKERVQRVQNKLEQRAQKRAFNAGVNNAKDKIKGAIGKVKSWVGKIGNDDSPIGLSRALARQAERNAKNGEPNFGIKSPSVQPATNAIKTSADNTKVAKAVKPKVKKQTKTEPKVEEPKKEEQPKVEAKVEEPKKEEQPKVEAKVEEPKKEEQPKAKVEEPKKEKDAGDRIHKEVEDYIKKADKEEAKRKAKEEKEVEERKKRSEKVLNSKTSEPKKEEQPKVEDKVEEPKKEEQPKAEEPKKEETKEDKRSRLLKRALAASKASEDSGQRQKDQQRLLDTYKDRLQNMKAKPGYSSEEVNALQKKIDALEGKLAVKESIKDLAILLLNTNINESSFVEIMKTVNTSIKEQNKLENIKKFQKIAEKLLKTDNF